MSSFYFFLLKDTFLLLPLAVSPSSAPFSVSCFTDSYVIYVGNSSNHYLSALCSLYEFPVKIPLVT